MSELGVVILLIATAISITYFIYSVWHAFILKKQMMIGLVDFVFWETAGIFGGCKLYDLYGIKGPIALFGLVALWLAVLATRCNKNREEKEDID